MPGAAGQRPIYSTLAAPSGSQRIKAEGETPQILHPEPAGCSDLGRKGGGEKKAGNGMGLVSLTSFLLSLPGIKLGWSCLPEVDEILSHLQHPVVHEQGINSCCSSPVTGHRITHHSASAACQLCEFHKHPAFSHFRTHSYSRFSSNAIIFLKVAIQRRFCSHTKEAWFVCGLC